MYNARHIHCANCGTAHVEYLGKDDVIQFFCKNASCNVSIRSSFKNEKNVERKIITTYRYDSAKVEFTGLFCENCGCIHKGFLDEKNRFKTICKCGASIMATKTKTNEIKISTIIKD